MDYKPNNIFISIYRDIYTYTSSAIMVKPSRKTHDFANATKVYKKQFTADQTI